MTQSSLDPANPFATPSTFPYGLPDFTVIREEHYLPALLAGMAEQRAEIEAIATDPQPPPTAGPFSGLMSTLLLLLMVKLVLSAVSPMAPSLVARQPGLPMAKQ
jgi:Zn-dependent oligopeptidase